MALTSTLDDLFDREELRTMQVDLLLDDRALVEVYIALFECPPVLFGDDLIIVWLSYIHAGQVFKPCCIKLSFLLISHVCQVEKLSVYLISEI